ncbi:MAG: hypothetical protein N0A15_03040 [Anaerolineae bacterium]|nr:hypothetical protein [Anaerolineae bacterium]
MSSAVSSIGWEDICGCHYRLPCLLDCRGLYDPSGLLWMSDTPQERLMMYNNARASNGHVLIGGLGLGLYPQYVAPRARSITVVERSADIIAIVWPVIEPVLCALPNGPCPRLVIADVETFLQRSPDERYDTIFLDTWEELNAVRLPHINWLRDLAICHLAPGGRVLPWGYHWMVRLFEEACSELLRQPPGHRASWLAKRSWDQPAAATLLAPVAERFAGRALDDLNGALAWCRRYIAGVKWCGL